MIANSLHHPNVCLCVRVYSVISVEFAPPGTIVHTAKGLVVSTGDQGFILLTEVQPENKKRISAQDFINGHQIKGGIAFDEV